MPDARKIFYAWQSDTPSGLNHRFIREAADRAIARIITDALVEEADAFDRVELDHDTKGVPGSPNVAETICTKIDKCAAFIADLTTVGRYRRRSDGAVKKVANPNVLIELGFARRSKGVDRIITVQNRAFGSPDDLPFDLRYLRHPIQYELRDAEDPQRGEKLAQLAGQLKHALRAILELDSHADAAEELSAGADGNDLAVVRAREERRDFEARVISGDFYNFQASRGILALSVIPLTSPPRLNLVELNGSRIIREFRPPRADQWDHSYYGRAVVVHQTFNRNFREPGIPVSLAELTDQGRVFAADNWLKISFSNNDAGRVVPFVMGAYEPETIISIAEYLRMLKSLAIEGPFQISVSLLRIKDFRLVPRRNAVSYESSRSFAVDDYRTLPVLVQAGDDISTDDAVAKLMRPMFDEIWRECGYPYDVLFDRQTGEYEGFRELQR